jgi:hypothetical protein
MRRGDEMVPQAIRLSAGSRRTAGLEFAALVSGVLAIMWIVPFLPAPDLVKDIFVGSLLLLLVFCRVREDVSWRALGFRVDNFVPVLFRLTPYFGGLILGLLSIGAAAGTLRFGVKSWLMLPVLPLWALLQQYMLLAFAHRRLCVLLGSGQRCTWATATLFGIMHLPNPMLTLVCAFGGFVWAREYSRSPNLYAHVVTHTVGSMILASSLPRVLLKNMVVGYRYFLN